MSVRKYLEAFRRKIEKLEDYGYADFLEIGQEIRPNKHLDIKAKAVLVDGSILYIREYIAAKYKIERLSYAYHYQDSGNELIFRYDNAMHKPPLRFREHKHTRDGRIIKATLPHLSDLIDEMIERL